MVLLSPDHPSRTGSLKPKVDLSSNCNIVSRVVDVCLTTYTVVAVLEDGQVRTWGRNIAGLLAQKSVLTSLIIGLFVAAA